MRPRRLENGNQRLTGATGFDGVKFPPFCGHLTAFADKGVHHA